MDWDLYFLDCLLLSMLILVSYKGYKRGVINQVIWLCSFVLAYFVAAYFCYSIADLADFPVYNKNISVALAFIVVFSVVVVGMYYAGNYLTRILNLTIAGLINSMLGGLLNGLIYTVIVLSLSNVVLYLIPKADSYLDKTVSLGELVKFEKWLMDQDYVDKIKDQIKDLN